MATGKSVKSCHYTLRSPLSIVFFLSDTDLECCLPKKSRPVMGMYLWLQFAEGVILNLDTMWGESTKRTPLIGFLSMGSDPTENIERLAKQKGFSEWLLRKIFDSQMSLRLTPAWETKHLNESLQSAYCVAFVPKFCQFCKKKQVAGYT